MEGFGGDGLSATDLEITVDLLTENSQPIEQKTLAAAASGGSNSSLRSTNPISLEGASFLVVNVSHPGYTSYSRRVAVEEIVYLNTELQAVEEMSVSMTQTASVSGTMVDGFTLTLPAEEGEGDIQVGIPRSLLPQGTTSVTAELKSFDPNDPEDAQNFPGDYADTDGNNLVSVAFNYADIRTADGQSLTALAKARQNSPRLFSDLSAAEATEPVIINRSIPASSCNTLTRLGDANTEIAGFQIPVYSYDSSRGLWELLGYGTVYTSGGTLINSVDVEQCEDSVYVLEISVSSEIFLSNWWNLDYPLIFSQPVKYCAKIRLQTQAGAPLKGQYGFYYGDAAVFANSYFVTDDKGEASLEVEAADAGDMLTANIAIFGETNYYSEATLSRNCSSPETQTLVANLPRLCQINGILEYPDGSPATRHPVLAAPTNFVLGDYIDFSASDSTGQYWLNASCEKDYDVTVYSTDQETSNLINVNGSVGADEETDNGDIATLPTITVAPIPTSIYASVYSTVDKRILMFFLGHRDNFPIRYDLTMENTAGQEIGSLTGTAQLSEEAGDDEVPFWYFGFSQIEIDLDMNTGDATTVLLKGTLTDSRDETTAVNSAVPVVDEPLSSVTDD